MADDQLQQELLRRSATEAERSIPQSIATAALQMLVSTAAGQWTVKTIDQVKALLGLTGTNSGDQDLSSLVPYSGAAGDVDLGAHDLAAASISAGAGELGGVTGAASFEEGTGYQVLTDDAGGFVDIFFPHGVPKTTGPGNPSLATYLGGHRGYAYQVDDAHDFDPQEYYHQCEVGAPIIWHLHFLTRSNDGTDRFLKFELEASYVAPNGVETALPLGTLEYTIPAGSTVNTMRVRDIATSTIEGIGPVWMLSARLKRVAAAGAAPSVDPIVKALHAHVKIDTPQGSHTDRVK